MMRTHRLIYEGTAQGLFDPVVFDNFVTHGLGEKLGHKTITVNPEVMESYTLYHLPDQGTGIQYLITKGRAQIGLLGRGAKNIGDIILTEALKYNNPSY